MLTVIACKTNPLTKAVPLSGVDRSIMTNEVKNQPDWVTRGKTIRQLIEELKTFEDQELEVQISLDDGETHKPVSILVKRGGYCLIVNSE
jgi:hypothetical protein